MAENEDNVLQRAAKAVSSWVKTTFPNHPKAFIGGVLGLICALLFLALGIWKTLVVVVFVVVGVAIGQYLEGDPKIMVTIRDWLSNRH